MVQTDVRVPWSDLKEFTKEVFVRLGMAQDDAAIESEVLLWANLRGVDSHGVLRLRQYHEWTQLGLMNPRPNIQVLTETPATILVDADHSFGPIVTTFTMRKVIEKAKNVGIGWGLIKATAHQGAIGYYSLMAANEGMIGLTFTAGTPNMAVHGAKAAGVSNGPIAIAVPAHRYRPVILDMATSVAAMGKLSLATDKGLPVPEGWALDKDGNPTTDPQKAREGVLLPFSGPKGSGLAFMMEAMASITAGNPRVAPVLSGTVARRAGGQNSVVAAVNIATFADLQWYKEEVDKTVEAIKALPRAEGVDEILAPGEPEWHTYDDRTKNGIPLPSGTVANMKLTAQKLELDWPFPF